MKNRFNFFTKAKITKSKDKNGDEVMKIGGIASTIDTDSEGENLDPNGFILDDLLNVGFINWHHRVKDKPITIIGEPTLAQIRPDGLYIECELYKSNPIAKEVYELAKILEKDSKTRNLGFSIEGEVVERASDDETSPDYHKIKKAVITGIAITHMPINQRTFAQVIKAFKEGEDILVDKSINTENSANIIKESLDDGNRKNIVADFNVVDLDEESMYDKIFDTFTDINIHKAEKVYNLIENLKINMKKGKIDNDKLTKAMDALGLPVSDENPFLEKSSKEDEKLSEKISKENYEDDEEDMDDEETDDSDEIEKGKQMPEENNEPEKEKEIVKKSAEETVLKSKPNGVALIVKKEIEKSKNQSTMENRALGVITKAILQENFELKEELSNIKNIVKAQEKGFQDISNKLDNLFQVPNERKSVTSFTERFDKSAEDNILSNRNTLSKSRDRQKILDILDNKSFEKGFDEDFSKATVSFEASGKLPKDIVEKLGYEGIIITE